MPVLVHVSGDEVADIGCGSGVYGYLMRAAWQFTGSWYFENLVAARRLIGVDWSPRTVELLRAGSVYDEVHLASSDELPLEDDAVDTAISVESLEHLLPGKVPVALAELSRIARHKVVICTPAPWSVVNVQFLDAEMAEAQLDDEPLGYDEFMNLVGNLHKSSVTPEQMEAAGFNCRRNRLGAVPTVGGSVIYTAEPSAVNVDQLGSVVGVPWDDYPPDDGRKDWSDAYTEALRDSMSMTTRRRAPLRQPISAVLRGVREELHAFRDG